MFEKKGTNWSLFKQLQIFPTPPTSLLCVCKGKKNSAIITHFLASSQPLPNSKRPGILPEQH